MPQNEDFFNPYRWVPISGAPIQRAAPLHHHRLQGIAGRLHLTLKNLTPFLINDGKGQFVNSRRTLKPYIPGTSLKGMIRSLAELIGNAATPIDRSKVDSEHATDQAEASGDLDICARMFGFLNRKKIHAGLVRFSDGHPEGPLPETEQFRVAGGAPDIDHRPFYPNRKARKLYHHKAGATSLTPPHAGLKPGQIRSIRMLKPGGVFKFKVDFQNLRDEELNLLLYALVLEENVTVTLSEAALGREKGAGVVVLKGPLRHKLGYGKPQGGGSVHLALDKFELRKNPGDRYRGKQGSDWELEGQVMQQEVQRRIGAFVKRSDPTMLALRAMMIYAEGDPRAKALDYPTYAWFQEDKNTPGGTGLKPTL